jgi:hypothetical protein
MKDRRMLRKKIVISLLIFPLVFLVNTNTWAANQVKAGIKCPKVGQVTVLESKKFTCIKAGSKSIWDKGLVLLTQPLFIASPAVNNYEWEITVSNYLKKNDPSIEFSYSFAVDGGIWNLFSKTNNPREKIEVNQTFRMLEIKVAVSDQSNQYLASTKFERVFRVPVVPPQSILPNDSAINPKSSLPSTVNILQGVQWRNESGYYIGSTPASKILLRWPKPLDNNIRGFIIRYENTSMITAPCDLAKALCDSPKRVDTKVYKKVIADPSAEFVVIDGLIISSTYEFMLYSVSGGTGSLENIELPTSGFRIFVLTTGEVIPGAPTDVTVG